MKPEQLHKWYLEAIESLKPESFNPDAQKSYESLTDEQKNIDKYIANKINNEMQKNVLFVFDSLASLWDNEEDEIWNDV